MSEEDKSVEDVVEEEQEIVEYENIEASGGEEQEYSEVELEAIEHGWNPEGVEGKRNLSAEEFMDRQKFYDDIRALKRENKATREQLDALKKYQGMIREKERERVINELKAKKKLALESEDYDSVIEIDEQMGKLHNEKEEEDTPSQTFNQEFEDWVDRNSWYKNDPDLKEEADTLGNAYFQRKGGNVSPSEVFKYVEQRIKKMYPDKFEKKTAGKKAPSVEGGKRSSAGKNKSKYSEADLPAEHRQIMNTLVKSGTVTKEEYLKDYFE